MTIREIIQELKRYNFDLETNVIGFKKTDVLEIEVANIIKPTEKKVKEEQVDE